MHTGRVLEQGQETLDPAIDRGAIDDETALGKPLDDVRVTQAIPDIPAHGQRDHIVGETMMRESAGRASSEAATTRVAPPPLSAQSRLPVLARPLAPTPNALHDQPLSHDLRSVIVLPISLQQYPDTAARKRPYVLSPSCFRAAVWWLTADLICRLAPCPDPRQRTRARKACAPLDARGSATRRPAAQPFGAHSRFGRRALTYTGSSPL